MNVIINIFGERHRPCGRFNYKLGQVEPKKRKCNMPIEVSLTNEQQVTVTLAPVTETGKPAQLDQNNKPTWTVVSGLATVVPSEDGLSAKVVSSDLPGDSQIAVVADADLGEGVVEIADVITVKVAGARAVSLGITVGTPEPKP